MKLTRLLAILALALSINAASAYMPAGWTYFGWPYAYDTSSQGWYYFNEADTQWCVDLATGNWSQLGDSSLPSGWVYWQWPYAYNWSSGKWFYLNADTQWCLALPGGTWSRLGEAAYAMVAGTWTGTYTMPSGESSPDELILTQSGSSVNGTLKDTPVSGTVDGNHVSLLGATVRNGVAWSKKLEASVSGETMTGVETWGMGDVGEEPIWLSPLTVSLTRTAN